MPIPTFNMADITAALYRIKGSRTKLKKTLVHREVPALNHL